MKSPKKRATRVKVLKHIIVGAVITLNLLPILFCMILFSKIQALNNQVDILQQSVTQLLEEQNLADSNKSEQIITSNQSEKNDSLELDVLLADTDTQELNPSNEDQGSGDSGFSENTEASYEGMKKVYLTFDDGPSKYTDDILDILKEYNVKATFFVVGKEGEVYQDLYKRIVDEGHTIALHSYSHEYEKIYKSVNAYRTDLVKLHDFILDLTGSETNIVRFPGGSSNTISDVPMQEFIGYLNDNGYVYYDWNVSSGDAAEKLLSTNEIVSNIVNDVELCNEAVVLMHDAANRSTTVEALPIVIEKILQMDNTVILPITEDTKPIQHIQIDMKTD